MTERLLLLKPGTKPPYRVPSMAEINALPWNGFTAISTFSGCGGSSLGYRMAGFRVLWASEFIPAARDSYNANKGPHTILDGRDIRQVQPQDILDAVGLRVGELDLMDGSPPCAAFSTAGKREAGWNKVKAYSDTKQRVDDLFDEFIRLVGGLQPRVFIAENVYGLVKGTAKGYFLEVLAAFKACGYRVEAKLLDAQWLGVPQQRQRLIFQGVRTDLGLAPTWPKPLAYRYSVRDALPNIRRHGTAPPHAVYEAQGRIVEATFTDSANEPNPTIVASGQNKGVGWVEDFPPGDRVVHDTSGLFGTGDVTDRPCPPITVGVHSLNAAHYQVHGPAATPASEKAARAEADISRFAIGDEWDKLKPGEQSDKYFNLVRPSPDDPSPTITQMGGVGSAASVTHPTEKRKFTIAELRRICAFPDDFQLTGSYAQQWERLGRAVPPVMMSHLAEAVRRGVLEPSKTKKGRG